ncbi:type VII secretion target [Mycobacterium sp. SMC-4]|uniref:type VII secretion target n=1 Tax=Mycobacterium sp. SMC-4 TaxID=2857059 RepID=UPI0021B213B6|nr:type VII secretion target [Mycobacterium sp. SMC-4]
MSVDTDTVRRYGTAASSQAADLHAVAQRLGTVGSGSAAAFGPVGARFLAALTRAAVSEAHAITALGGSLSVACDAAHATARAYQSTDFEAGVRVAGLR